MHARYTEVLVNLMENEQTKQLLNNALSTYPLYTPKTPVLNIPERSELNRRLLNAYKYREIGFETVGRFLDELQMTMCEIMPYYNERYKTIEIMAGLENPFDNVDVTETYSETSSGEATTESESTSTGNTSSGTETTSNGFSKKVHSATPQSELSISANDIDSVNYADDAEWNKANSSEDVNTHADTTAAATNQGTQTTQTTVEHTLSKKGNQGVNTYAHDMIEFRTSIIDVTNEIINDERISELFMRVF